MANATFFSAKNSQKNPFARYYQCLTNTIVAAKPGSISFSP